MEYKNNQENQKRYKNHLALVKYANSVKDKIKSRIEPIIRLRIKLGQGVQPLLERWLQL